MAPSRKHPLSPPALIANPFIKKRNLAWSLEPPSSEAARLPLAEPSASLSPTDCVSARASVSPPAAAGRPTAGTTSEIESGAVQISDHLARFSSILASHLYPTSALVPRLSVADYSHLYERCVGSPSGAHFVIHQHDHPVAGTHYDLRLQINETSSVSWAVMYGPPGDANSIRLNRNATETRIHSLWATSPETGTLLIWDTGTYSVLPRRSKHAPSDDPSSPPGSPHASSSSSDTASASAQSLLHAAFQTRKIRLRLHGTKLPDPYVISLRLTKSEDAAGRSRSSKTPRTRRRARTTQARPPEPEITSSSSDEHDDGNGVYNEEPVGEPQLKANDDAPPLSEQQHNQGEEEDAQVRLTNAYHGASNTIGSIYQRRWYLSLDRRACGFTQKKRSGRSVWEPPPSTPGSGPCRFSFPFYVRGPQFEQSVVTGRRGEDILRDEGVTTFVPRKGWTPVMK
ncbi:abc1 domain-containing [Trichoderma arundinaceum]|uniref:Abc1 domain-containing n=1 Tax=Trichoderma arundinaceum TaxID=490622 RepID=A0A395NLF4_TRIAR|nr:abc1 domain-containing [Trichoderma arundinaceum]